MRVAVQVSPLRPSAGNVWCRPRCASSTGLRVSGALKQIGVVEIDEGGERQSKPQNELKSDPPSAPHAASS